MKIKIRELKWLLRDTPRWLLTIIVGRSIAFTSFRFSKDYRWGTTTYHKFVYSCICTFGSNIVADGGQWPFKTIVLGRS